MEVKTETGRGRVRFKVWDHFADGRFSQAILDFFSTTDAGKLAPSPAEEDGQNKTSEWEFRSDRRGGRRGAGG